jgi:NAD(P)H-hydrate epimerase
MSAPAGSDRVRLTRAQLRELDRLAIEEYGLPGVVLMENAGAGAARIALELLGPARGTALGPVVIACGAGNNGGDGWVVARHLSNRGVALEVISLVDPARLSGEAAVMAQVALRMGIACQVAPDAAALVRLVPRLARAALIVDALLGTGASGAPRPPYDAAIAALAAAGAPVLSLDLPSGFDADLGEVRGTCVAARVTATFAAEKIGFAAPGAARWLGEVRVVDIGAPSALLARVLALPSSPAGLTAP